MYQKYPDGVRPRFAASDMRDYSKPFPQDEPGLISTISTPTINAFKTRLDMGDIQLVEPEIVKEFTLFANCLQHSTGTAVAVPGDDVAIVAQVVSIDPTLGEASLKLTDKAFKGYTLSCREFHGGLLVSNASGANHHLILDGLRFVSDDTTPAPVRQGRQGYADPPPATALPRVKASLEFSMAFAEAALNDREANPDSLLQVLVRDYFQWVAEVVPSGQSDADLLDLRVRALDLAARRPSRSWEPTSRSCHTPNTRRKFTRSSAT